MSFVLLSRLECRGAAGRRWAPIRQLWNTATIWTRCKLGAMTGIIVEQIDDPCEKDVHVCMLLQRALYTETIC